MRRRSASPDAPRSTQFVLQYRGFRRGSRRIDARARRKHAATSRNGSGEFQRAKRLVEAIIDEFESAFAAVGLVPEIGPAGIAEKGRPPVMMRKFTRPFFQRVEIAPILPHAGMRRDQRE